MTAKKKPTNPFWIMMLGVFIPFMCVGTRQLGGIIGLISGLYLLVWVVVCFVFMFYMLFVACKDDSYSSF